MSRKEADKADIARRAIKYLDQNALVFEWDFPQAAPPSEEIRNLLKSYFADGEIERTTAGFVCGYLIERLSEDYLADEWSHCAPGPVARRYVVSSATTATMIRGQDISRTSSEPFRHAKPRAFRRLLAVTWAVSRRSYRCEFIVQVSPVRKCLIET